MISLSLYELKLITKSGSIKHCESKSKDELMKILIKPKPKIFFSKLTINKIRKKFD